MIILSIETSCDDTGISIIKTNSPLSKKKVFGFSDFEILSDVVSSQNKVHAKYGGVFPSLAKREHQKNLIPVLTKVLKTADLLKRNKKGLDIKRIEKVKKILDKNPELFINLKPFLKNYAEPEVNKIAVTIGPGLEPSLWTGINLARALSYYYKIPLMGINHIEAHILSSWLSPIETVPFPATALVVSGGNTQLIYMETIGKYKLLGETRDDAAGECFDKTARILGLSYPGGPSVSKAADKFIKTDKKLDIHLPRPMIHDKNYDFSFSGLKTAVLYDFKGRSQETRKSSEYVNEMAYEIEQSIIDVLVSKTIKAAEEYGTKSIIIGGGVSANKKLIKAFKEKVRQKDIKLFFPIAKFSGDNGSMVGITAIISRNAKKVIWQKIKAESNLKINGK